MKIRKTIIWIMCVLILLGLVGCSAPMKDVVSNGMTSNNAPKEDITVDTENASVLPENRKLIQTVNMHVETENLDAVLQQINIRISDLGGYVENSNIQNGSAYNGNRYRSAAITIRIPAKDLDSFLDKMDEVSNIVSSQKTVEDVTLSYVATESRMKALQAEETRLLELMSKAETLDDLLTVEKRLTDVRTELEKVASALRVFDNQVDFATVHLNINEVKEFTEITESDNIWQRIGTGFSKSLKNIGTFFEELFVFLMISLPYLVLLALIPLCIVLIVRFHNRKNRNKDTKEERKDNS